MNINEANAKIVQTLKEVSAMRNIAHRLCIALEVFHDLRSVSDRTAKVVASVGRATIRKEDAKGFIAVNPAQTIDVIKNKLTALEKRINKSEFIAWCRDTDLQQQVAKGLEHCESFLAVWKEKGSTIKSIAKAA